MASVFVAGDEVIVGRVVDLERLSQENRIQAYALRRRLIVGDDGLERFHGVEALLPEAVREKNWPSSSSRRASTAFNRSGLEGKWWTSPGSLIPASSAIEASDAPR